MQGVDAQVEDHQGAVIGDGEGADHTVDGTGCVQESVRAPHRHGLEARLRPQLATSPRGADTVRCRVTLRASVAAPARQTGAATLARSAGTQRDRVEFRTGTAWQDVPERYGSWATLHTRFRRWVKGGTFQ